MDTTEPGSDGGGGDLRSTSARSAPHGLVDELRRTVDHLHRQLVANGLVAWTSGNVSARVPGHDLLVIKPSGVPYEELTPEAMVLCSLDGRPV
ncbi:MAG: class II aldolase/adducin family protein, partial [Dermatophilaceae bacterium]